MKNPRLFWGIVLIIFLCVYSFIVDLSAEEQRYIQKANFPEIGIEDGSPAYYGILNAISNYTGPELAIRLIKFVFIGFFLLISFIILERNNKLENLLLFIFYPSFMSLIFTQDKNLFTLALLFAGIEGIFPLFLAPLAGLVEATFYGIQSALFLPLFLFFGKKAVIPNGVKILNIILLVIFAILIISWWGSRGFLPSSPEHEDVGLVNTVLFLVPICALDGSLFGTASVFISIILFVLGLPYWAYRPLEAMAINAVLNGEAGIILKTLSQYMPAWLKEQRT